jgi:hypothetical protein
MRVGAAGGGGGMGAGGGVRGEGGVGGGGFVVEGGEMTTMRSRTLPPLSIYGQQPPATPSHPNDAARDAFAVGLHVESS